MNILHSTLIFLFITAGLDASPIPEFPHLTARGNSSKSVAPDRATITFTVTNFSEKSVDAVDHVNDTLKTTVMKLINLGVKKDKITAGDLEKSITRERNKDYQDLKIIGYQVERTVSIELDDLKNYPTIATLIFKTDLVKQIRSQFWLSTADEVNLSLLEEACRDARKKADALAKASGVTIEKIFGISPEGEGYTFKYGEVTYAMNGLPMMSSGASGGDEAPPLFVPKEIEIATSVSVLFKLKSVADELEK